MEFLWSKGVWQVCGNDTTTWVENELWSIAVIFIKEEEQETKANALLISKAPEMLEMLKDLKNKLGTHFEREKIEIEQLIKEATTI